MLCCVSIQSRVRRQHVFTHGIVYLWILRARTVRTVREDPCTSMFPWPMRESILTSTCPREAYTDGCKKSVDDSQYLFLDVRGMHLQSSADDYHASQDRQWTVWHRRYAAYKNLISDGVYCWWFLTRPARLDVLNAYSVWDKKHFDLSDDHIITIIWYDHITIS